jgi:hypothetical protein
MTTQTVSPVVQALVLAVSTAIAERANTSAVINAALIQCGAMLVNDGDASALESVLPLIVDHSDMRLARRYLFETMLQNVHMVDGIATRINPKKPMAFTKEWTGYIASNTFPTWRDKPAGEKSKPIFDPAEKVAGILKTGAKAGNILPKGVDAEDVRVLLEALSAAMLVYNQSVADRAQAKIAAKKAPKLAIAS